MYRWKTTSFPGRFSLALEVERPTSKGDEVGWKISSHVPVTSYNLSRTRSPTVKEKGDLSFQSKTEWDLGTKLPRSILSPDYPYFSYSWDTLIEEETIDKY